jgi:predicted lactoylglutathione lyase
MATEIVSPQSFAIGGSELAFGLAENTDVDLVHEKWRLNGIAIAQPPGNNAFAYSFLAADPDGHRLRVYCFHGFKKMVNFEPGKA